jgi:uncharacterized protein (TIGR02145 family)
MILSNAKHIVLIALLFIGYNAFSQLKVDRSSEEIKVAKSSAVFNLDVTYGTMTDQDGNEYKTVQIGNQIWMAENLRTTKYTDGTPIPMVSRGDWSKQTEGAYCTNENSNDPTLIATYGFLYNWHTIATGKIAPEGWRVPTNDDWAALAKAFGSKFTAGGKLKEAGTAHWKAPNKDASNESGFTAMPSGQITDYSRFMYFETQSFIWSATESSSTTAFYQSMSYVNDDLTQAGANKKFGHAIRLVKDAEGTASASGSETVSSSNASKKGLLEVNYDQAAGCGTFYRDGKLLKKHCGWSTNWHTIVVVGCVNNSPLDSKVLFYDKTSGTAQMYKVDAAGNMQLLQNFTGFSTGWTSIIWVGESICNGLIKFETADGYWEKYSCDDNGNINLHSKNR